VKTGLSSHGQAIVLSGVKDGEVVALRNPFETRKLYLPDFSKATAADSGGAAAGEESECSESSTRGFITVCSPLRRYCRDQRPDRHKLRSFLTMLGMISESAP